jgi:hypothetical protein
LGYRPLEDFTLATVNVRGGAVEAKHDLYFFASI